MKKTLSLFAALLWIILPLRAQVSEIGPYTISHPAPGVIHIEDANSSNPSGVHTDAAGKNTGQNNCSDMYLITGKDKVLLVDLSNFIKWDTSAISSLKSIVRNAAGGKKVYITVTHNHGDHLGMLPAFKDDPAITFWIPDNEFRGKEIFPSKRTIFFPENASLDLGGDYVINSLELPGHTPHSTVFFLKGKNLLFSGDAIGSGNGVWLFNAESFISYRESIKKLTDYINNPSNRVNSNDLIIFGGHFWQKGKKEKLTAQYVYDMKTLIEKIIQGTASEEKVNFNRNYLDTNFSYGSAVITWNKADAEKYSKK